MIISQNGVIKQIMMVMAQFQMMKKIDLIVILVKPKLQQEI